MILLDTHVIIWLLIDPGRLSTSATKAIQQCASEQAVPFISSVSFYEIARALHRGRVETVLTPEEFCRRVQSYVRAIPPNASISLIAAQLSAGFPNDPMDRIIAATAITEGASLVTSDRSIRKSRLVKTIW